MPQLPTALLPSAIPITPQIEATSADSQALESGKAVADAAFSEAAAAAAAPSMTPTLAVISERIFSESVTGTLGLKADDLIGKDEAALEVVARRAWGNMMKLLHPDFGLIVNGYSSDARMSAWVAASLDLERQQAKLGERPPYDAAKDLANKAFEKVNEAKRAFDLWTTGKRRLDYIVDPVLDHPAWAANQKSSTVSSMDAAPPQPASFRANPVQDMGYDFDYLRHGTLNMKYRPRRQHVVPLVADADDRLLKAQRSSIRTATGWFEG